MASDLSGVFAGQLREPTIIPMVHVAPQSGRTVAVDGAPGDRVRALIVAYFSEPGVSAPEPKILTARSVAGGERRRHPWSPVQAGQDTGILLWTLTTKPREAVDSSRFLRSSPYAETARPQPTKTLRRPPCEFLEGFRSRTSPERLRTR